MVKDIIKFFFYFIIISFMLIGGNLHILGPFSARHLSMFMLFIVYFVNGTKVQSGKIKPAHLNIYLIFLGVYIVCNVLNGEFLTSVFLQSFYTYHIPCLALVFGLPAIIKNEHDLRIMVKCIIALFLINLILSYLQFNNNSVAWIVASQISSSAEEGIESAELYNNAYGSIFGYSIVMGLFGFVVTNGYFIASYLPIATSSIYKGRVNLIIGIIILLFTIYIGYVVQQRMAFIMILLYVFYLVAIKTQKARIVLWTGIGLVVIFVLQSSFWETLEFGRLTTSQNNDTRLSIFDDFIDYIGSSESIFGGQVAYHEKYHKYQHNTFTASYTLGGIFTFVTYCILYFKLLITSTRIMRSKTSESKTNSYVLSFALSSIVFLGYSLTHTAGVHSGSPMFWLVYSLLFISIEFENNKNNISYD